MYSTKFSPRNGTTGKALLAVRDSRKLWIGLLCLMTALFFSLPALAQVDVQVTWNANSEPDLAGYTVWWGTEPGVYSNPQDAGTATSDIIYGLSEGTTYYIAVTASDLAGNDSEYSDPASITPDLTPPTFSNINAGSITENSVTITWTTDEPATSLVRYGEEIAYGSQTTLDPALVTSHSVPITGLSDGTTYHYQVESTDGSDNTSTSSDRIFDTLDETAPAAPTGVDVVVVS